MNLSCYYAETALSRLLNGAISNIGLKPVTLSQLLPSILTDPMRLTTTHDFIQQRHQDNQLMCQLSQERIRLINTVTYQQATLELKCVELLACVQQKMAAWSCCSNTPPAAVFRTMKSQISVYVNTESAHCRLVTATGYGTTQAALYSISSTFAA